MCGTATSSFVSPSTTPSGRYGARKSWKRPWRASSGGALTWIDADSASAWSLVARVIVEQSEGTRRPHIEPRRLLETLGRVAPEFSQLVTQSQELADELEGR